MRNMTINGGVDVTRTITESRNVRLQLSRAEWTVFHPASPSLVPSILITFLSSLMGISGPFLGLSLALPAFHLRV